MREIDKIIAFQSFMVVAIVTFLLIGGGIKYIALIYFLVNIGFFVKMLIDYISKFEN